MNPLVRNNEWKWLTKDPFSSFHHNWDNLYPNTLFRFPVQSSSRVPAVDIKETDSEYKVVADLPGIAKDNLEVTVDENYLKIVVNAQEDNQEESDGRVIRRERFQGQITRSFKLGNTVESDKIQANYKDGVLSIVVPKKEERKTRKIDVSVH